MKVQCVFVASAVLVFTTTTVLASSDEAWKALDKASAKSCIAAAGFLNGKISPATRFSDGVGYDTLIVSGTFPQKHMKGAKGQMLCLYNRKTKQVEVQELAK